MNETIKQLDVVTLLVAMPENGLAKGQVGAVLEVWSSDAFEVEFVDLNGQTIAILTLHATQIMRLCYEQMYQKAA